MNIEQSLDEHMAPISYFNGVCLSVEEKIRLETILDQLKSDIKCDEMLFWGKIIGAEKDYYVSLALFYKNKRLFPGKKFFFCSSSNFNFSELPEIQRHHLPDFQKFNTYFIGNPDIILKEYENNSKNLTESDRLSYIVRTIEHDTAVVPIGGFKMLPNKELRRNDTFEGLTNNGISQLKNYLHFRQTESQEKKDLISMDKAIFNFNFLDSLTEDKIKNSWNIQTDSSKSVACIRSEIWPGYYAYHKANTNLFGGVYFGHGIKSNDIAFMQ